MTDFEELTEEQQNEVIMQISSKLTGQEIWYWEGIVHKLREYEKFFDSDMEVRQGLIDRIERQEKEIEELKAKLEMYENGVYYSSENDKLQSRIDKAIEITKTYSNMLDTKGVLLYSNLLNALQGGDKE